MRPCRTRRQPLVVAGRSFGCRNPAGKLEMTWEIKIHCPRDSLVAAEFVVRLRKGKRWFKVGIRMS